MECGSIYHTIERNFKVWVIGYDFFVSLLKKCNAKVKIKTKVTDGGNSAVLKPKKVQ